MWVYLKKVNAKGVEKQTVRGMPTWISASRTPADRKKSRTLHSWRALVEVGVAKEEDVEYEVKRGIPWVGRHRVAEWKPEEEKLKWITGGLNLAGVDVESQKLDDAGREKMSFNK